MLCFSDLWVTPNLPENIPHGDMPGDKIFINEEHVKKAQIIYPKLRRLLAEYPKDKVVVSVCGGSGVGKSETASILAYYLSNEGIGTYVLSGDNYPRRIPKDNDNERERVYRNGGLRGLVSREMLSSEQMEQLTKLWLENKDVDLSSLEANPWLSVYQQAGRRALTLYLGTQLEIDFDEVSHILAQFQQNASNIYLKRMGREKDALWYDLIDFSNVQVLILEWTHGNSDEFEGIDIPIYLCSTPAETLAHRRERNRDGKTDSAFTTMVLEIEQKKLEAQAHKAKIIVSKQGQITSYAAYRQLMAKED